MLQGKRNQKNASEITSFPVPFDTLQKKEDISINKNIPSKSSKEQIINQAFRYHSEGDITEASKYYNHFINQGFKDERVFSNYGVILNDLGNLQEAEILYRKAIEINPNFAESYYNLGITLQKLSKYKEAEFYTRKAIKIKPNHAKAHLHLGIILKNHGKLVEAEIAYNKASKLKPDSAEVHINLGDILQGLGKLQEAELSYRKGIELKPNYADAHINLGTILQDLGKSQEAELSYRKAIKLKPDFSEAYTNLGSLLRDFGKLQEAEISTRKAIELKPNDANAHSNLGIILKDLGKSQEAEVEFLKAIKLKPDYAEAYSNLGIILKELGKLQEAKFSISKAIEINPNFDQAHFNLGNILNDLGNLQDAELSYRKAIKINPEFANYHYNLGKTLRILGKCKYAELSLRKAIELNPKSEEARYELSLVLLKTHNFEEGLNKYESRWKIKGNKKQLITSKLEWSNKNKGRVLLWGEQGVGDEILFASLIPELVNIVDQLIVQVDKRLIPLFKRSFDERIIYIHKNQKLDEERYDFQISMGSVIKYFRNNKRSFKKGKEEYIKANKIKTLNYRDKLYKYSKSKRLIGISWKSKSRAHKYRSISLEKFIMGIYIPNTCFVNLQYGDTKDEINNIKKKYGINIYTLEEVDTFNDLDNLASLINACDMVVSIENLIFALAGALGVESKILLRPDCTWYNGDIDLKSYWFKNQSFYRQSSSGAWEEALNQIKKEIENIN